MNNKMFFSIFAKLISTISVDTLAEYAETSTKSAAVLKEAITKVLSEKTESNSSSISVEEINKAIVNYTSSLSPDEVYDLIELFFELKK